MQRHTFPLSGTTDAQALPGLISQTHRKIREASADGAYDTRYCHDVLLRKKIRPLIPPRSGARYWPGKYHERNHAVANQHRSGSNEVWKRKWLSPSFSSGNGHVPYQNLAGRPSEPAELWCAGG
ncbi:transposase [Salmonella enterica subsp. enterica serovar Mississippi str. A4-633]|nr:transposase [Salmonella enterica subsp. enterica serovar Mississippi str. A4-633]